MDEGPMDRDDVCSAGWVRSRGALLFHHHPGFSTAKVAGKETLSFTFTDTAGNAGSGTIKRAGNDVLISVKASRVANRSCLVFYGDNIRLHPAR